MGIAALIAISVTMPLDRTAWTASAIFGVRPMPAVSSSADAYAWDTVNRTTFIPTLVHIIGNPRFANVALAALPPDTPTKDLSFKATGDSSAAVLTLSVTASDPVLARNIAGTALGAARSYISQLVDLYQLDRVSTSAATPVRRRQTSVEATLSLTALTTLVVAMGAAGVYRRRMLSRHDFLKAMP
jgi:hypothetical protein